MQVNYDGSDGTRELALNINSCDDFNEYNCRDGGCVDIASRCDGRNDCRDDSDEEDCDKIVLEPSYRLHFPPNPEDEEDFCRDTKAEIVFSVDVIDILGVDEVESIISIQYRVALEWTDGRLSFRNLRAASHMNTISGEEAAKIWYPRIVLHNTEKMEESKVLVT